ncbi:plasmid partitioning protein RepB [Ensifer sp. SL37]|uniref:plasmid partitioning protein RepB n=1 Tax=Ensifer sp. SL37 TaxID=2995137 RepID=UPI0022757996|nr:plasmid partitioning protein RepB [Ensifer sp. SL37]MCY1740939.1 plasmid partitioning protein RepB [Ensifer sp. SL37]
MSRKNVFNIAGPDAAVDDQAPAPLSANRPLASFEKPLNRASAVGVISQSLNSINDKAHRADALEKALASGQQVVDLDPNLVDSSFVADRLGMSAEELDGLELQIRTDGQLVPILVRPHPENEGRFQAAYGHRRLVVIRRLGIPVKAVVKNLTDEQLIVSQGQENSSRQDLTFIERAVFAARLEDRGFERSLITSALSIDKANLSRMIALVKQFPIELIEAIGSAPSFGRMRWAELAAFLEHAENKSTALNMSRKPEFAALSSDSRFEAIYDRLRPVKENARSAVWTVNNGMRPVRIHETSDKLSLTFDKSVDPRFGSFVEDRLAALYDEFRQSEMGKGD